MNRYCWISTEQYDIIYVYTNRMSNRNFNLEFITFNQEYTINCGCRTDPNAVDEKVFDLEAFQEMVYFMRSKE